ncbi:MAG: DNA-3-methyladenine glycosylase [Patescibacteria group bacterium]|nr:DNA-3-methyladenine glycosylase [Patescibacteria group bacterium]MCL5224140.1 DNA-3-methyladenine glycosylase [Patescibacteria group bacterium]
MRRRVLGKKFFDEPTLDVARSLLGKYMVRRRGKTEKAYMITEVEAYDGPRDKASHASHGRTPRVEVMFGEAGKLFVYFTYGMHWMLNVVTGPKDYPAAVLVRGVEGINGPGRVTKKLLVDKKLNGKKAAPSSGLWFEDRGIAIRRSAISRTSRIGVSYAGSYWASRKYRFVLSV